MPRGAAARTCIVEPNEIMTHDEIRAQRLRTDDLVFAFATVISCIQWLVIRRLLANSSVCPNCHILMSFILNPRCYDEHMWKCKTCKQTLSIRNNSFFTRSNLMLKQIVRIVFGWCHEHRQDFITFEAGLGESATHTIVDWASFCRDICAQSLQGNDNRIGGLNEDGSSKIVEIDESKFLHRKCHRGQFREGHWVFGGIERDSKKCFMEIVPDRTAETLLPLIRRYILPGSIIMSDDWPAYRTIGELEGGIYEHHVRVHQRNFVDPDDREVYTQKVENMWMRVKSKFGKSRALLPSYLHEFRWRDQYPRSLVFPEFLRAISLQYPL